MRPALRRIGRALLGRLRLATPPRSPRVINWDVTYACPLRCSHCYSESGRRLSRQLPLESLFRIGDVLGKIRPAPTVIFTGGEPLVVRGVVDVARRVRGAGARTVLYTSGFKLRGDIAKEAVQSFDRIAVSLDGADAAVNDFLRERAGSFDEAVRALEMLDAAALLRRRSGEPAQELGIEVTVMRTNAHQLERFCTELAPRFGALTEIRFGALIPTGLASREGFVDRELLDDEQMADLPALERRLARLAPPGVRVEVLSNLPFLMHPEQIRRGRALDGIVKIEADGRVRGMDIYEGTVGNVLEEPFELLWGRVRQRHEDPFVVEQLSRVRTMREWAAACRAIDLHFAAPEDRQRILSRDEPPPVPAGLRPERAPMGRPRRSLDVMGGR